MFRAELARNSRMNANLIQQLPTSSITCRALATRSICYWLVAMDNIKRNVSIHYCLYNFESLTKASDTLAKLRHRSHNVFVFRQQKDSTGAQWIIEIVSTVDTHKCCLLRAHNSSLLRFIHTHTWGSFQVYKSFNSLASTTRAWEPGNVGTNLVPSFNSSAAAIKL